MVQRLRMFLATGKLAFFINKGLAEDLVFRGTFGKKLANFPSNPFNFEFLAYFFARIVARINPAGGVTSTSARIVRVLIFQVHSFILFGMKWENLGGK